MRRAILAAVLVTTGCDQKVIENKVADDTVKQYEIAKRSGSPAEVCAQAMLVSAAYLQAQDEPNYKRWKTTEKADCAKAGMPP